MKPSKLLPTRQTYEDGLALTFAHFNAEIFHRSLPQPLFSLQRRRNSQGYFGAARFASRNVDGAVAHEIALNPAYFAGRPDREILSTLVHEMAHLWQACHGHPGRRGYHNREWAGLMLTLGLHPSHTGRPGGHMLGERMSHYIVPGDRFDVVCESLLASGFRLAWHDKQPPPRREEGGGDGEAGRQRFICPECRLKAWARPSARLVCGECGVMMPG